MAPYRKAWGGLDAKQGVAGHGFERPVPLSFQGILNGQGGGCGGMRRQGLKQGIKGGVGQSRPRGIMDQDNRAVIRVGNGRKSVPN